jgi:hypothetical protein
MSWYHLLQVVILLYYVVTHSKSNRRVETDPSAERSIYTATASARLLSKQPPHPLQHTVLLWVVRVVFGRNLEERWESGCVCLDAVSYLLRNVLVDEQDGDVLALLGELVESGFDGRVFRLCVDDEEVLLAVRRLRHVLQLLLGRVLEVLRCWRETHAYAGKKHACYSVLRPISTAASSAGKCAPRRQ